MAREVACEPGCSICQAAAAACARRCGSLPCHPRGPLHTRAALTLVSRGLCSFRSAPSESPAGRAPYWRLWDCTAVGLGRRGAGSMPPCGTEPATGLAPQSSELLAAPQLPCPHRCVDSVLCDGAAGKSPDPPLDSVGGPAQRATRRQHMLSTIDPELSRPDPRTSRNAKPGLLNHLGV